MNHENFEKLLDWLDAGAPGYIFTMKVDHVPVQILTPTRELRRQQTAKPECDTACCIAGWAAEQAGHDFRDSGWFGIKDSACEWLGISDGYTAAVLDLFSPTHADATPAEAAAAVRNFLKDQETKPWK